MLVCILAVVWSNARGYKKKTEARSVRNRYAAIAGAMVASSLIIFVAGLLGWRYWIIMSRASSSASSPFSGSFRRKNSGRRD